VTSVVPGSGPLAGGTSVTITGTNLTGASAVKFATTAAITFIVNSATSISATSPAGTGLVDVTVITPGGTSATSAADHFTYVGAPTVTSLAPSTGWVFGGTSVTVTGANFTGASAVNFGGAPASSFSVNSDASISATSPAGSQGPVDVTVTTVGGTSAITGSDVFSYFGPPDAPINVAAVPGSFSASVTWAPPANDGGSPITSYIVAASPSCIPTPCVVIYQVGAAIVTSLANGTPYTFTVRAVNAAGPGLMARSNSVVPAIPTITLLSTNHGPTVGGTTVRISGTNFLWATGVQFGNNVASFTIIDRSTITAVSPASSSLLIPTPVDVRVSVLNGLSAPVTADQFNYTTTCLSATLTPNRPSPQLAGTVVTMTATPFGCPRPSYKYFLRSPNGLWTPITSWTSNAQWQWNTSRFPLGTYQVNVLTTEYPSQMSEAVAMLSFTLTSTAPDCPGTQFRFWLQHACGNGPVVISQTASSSTGAQPTATPISGMTWTTVGRAWMRTPESSTTYRWINTNIAFILPRV